MNKFKEINELLKNIDLEFVEFAKIPSENKSSNSNLDIDKIYSENEIFSYNRIKSIANADVNKVKWNIAIEHLMTDMSYISQLIKSNQIQYPEKLKEFKENCESIFYYISNLYSEYKNTINSYKIPKSIDEMNVEELREYIKKHNIK